MNIIIYAHPSAAHQIQAAEAMASGFESHGMKATITDCRSARACDLAVMWSHRHTRIQNLQRNNERDYLIMEAAYIGDRMKSVSLGFNGLNGRAEFHNQNSPPDRSRAHSYLVKPWKTSGDYVLMMGQVATDCAVSNVDIKQWYEDTIKNIQDSTHLPIYFRPHPLSPDTETSVPTLMGSLDEALKDAACVVTYNSNTGVDAVLNGVPVVAMDEGSMVWDIASREIEDAVLKQPDRQQWLNNISYCQWTHEEIERGDAWDHLKCRYN